MMTAPPAVQASASGSRMLQTQRPGARLWGWKQAQPTHLARRPDANQTPGSRSHRSLARLAPRWHPVETATPRCAASQIMHAAGEDDSQTEEHTSELQSPMY